MKRLWTTVEDHEAGAFERIAKNDNRSSANLLAVMISERIEKWKSDLKAGTKMPRQLRKGDKV